MKPSVFSAVAATTLASLVAGQQVGTQQTETHPTLSTQQCTKSGGCTTISGSVVLDSNWRWLHTTSGTKNCYDGNTWDSTLCPDNKTCATNCAIEGGDYSGTYGITTSGNSLTLKFITKHQYGTNIGSRVYLLESETKYRMLKLKNKEFTFDVDLSQLGCGLNGALYLVEMEADGGMAKYSTNKAGAKYGTGYCDAQCPHDMKFINGEANVEGWQPSSNDANAGKGKYGTCCNEMDIWEANNMGSAYTPHVCTKTGPYRCSGTECGDTSAGERYKGVCDKDGCDFNSYRMGDRTFWGKGMTIDSTKPMTVVTQFITQGNSDTGDLIEIKRLYVQNGKVYENSYSGFPDLSGGPYNSITDNFCAAQKTLFGDTNAFKTNGGLKAMGDALGRGMVLVMSVWDDHEANMLWLDSSYPLDKDASAPGVARGACSTDSGKPTDVESNQASSQVKFSNIKWGEIGSTYTGTAVATSPRVSPTPVTSPRVSPVTSPGSNCSSPVSLNGQCGGQYYQGSTCCASGLTCKVVSNYYSQCVAGASPSPVVTCPNPVSLNGQCGGQYYTGSKCCSTRKKRALDPEKVESNSLAKTSPSAPKSKGKRKKFSSSAVVHEQIEDVASDDDIICSQPPKRTSKLLKKTSTDTSKNDLCVHARKISDVKSWLLSKSENLNHRLNTRLLLVTGPSGSGKLSTVLNLCKGANLQVLTWSNYSNLTEKSKLFESSILSESQSERFKSFLISSMYDTLSFSAAPQQCPQSPNQNRTKIIVLKEIPNLHLSQIQSHLRWYLGLANAVRLVIIHTDVLASIMNSEDATQTDRANFEWTKWTTEMGGSHIKFNPIARTFLQRAIGRICQFEKVELRKDRIAQIVDECGGDLRSAINSLQFYKKDINDRKANSLKGEDEDSDLVSFKKNEMIGMFHSLGKILYCKRNDEDEENAGNIKIDPESVAESSGSDIQTFNLFLHQNYAGFCSDVEELWDIAERISQAEILGSFWKSDEKNTLQSHALSIYTRSITTHTQNHRPNVHHQFKQMHKPQLFNALKVRRENLLIMSQKKINSTFGYAPDINQRVQMTPYMGMILRNMESNKRQQNTNELRWSEMIYKQAERLFLRNITEYGNYHSKPFGETLDVTEEDLSVLEGGNVLKVESADEVGKNENEQNVVKLEIHEFESDIEDDF
ncbi:hypothetical protein HK098_008235 [Nowakowskiella sp. JEL0407]|nr:hypothetical protein HK098_008235 [Nowakowskiella sp. JEL0407]